MLPRKLHSQLFNLYTIPLGTSKEAKPVEQGLKSQSTHTPKLVEHRKIPSPVYTIVSYHTVKNISNKKLWQITAIRQVFSPIFHNIPYANGLQLAKVFAKLPTVFIIRQTFLPPKFFTIRYCNYFLEHKVFFPLILSKHSGH